MGAGALGTVVGGLMAKSGHAVTLVGRKAHVDACVQHGIRISGIWGDHCVGGVRAQVDLEGLSRGDFDFILLTVKSYDTAAAVKAIAPLVDDDTLVGSYQNGLGNVETIAEHVGWANAFDVRAIYGARVPEPGHVNVTVIAQPTALGACHPTTLVDPIRALAEAMDEAGLPTVYSDRITTVLWSKVAYNCALNPLSALLDIPYGEVVGHPDTRSIVCDVIRELYAVGLAMGIELEPDNADEYMEHFFDNLIPPTAAHYASMREDFLRKRRTEIDALNGAIVRYGVEQGVPTPVNATLAGLVRAREALY